MSEELTQPEVAQRGYEAWNADDLEALLANAHPEAEFHSSGVFPGMEPVYRGEERIKLAAQPPTEAAIRELGLG